MPEEYLDNVDEADNVIGKDTREKVHSAHATHRGIHVFIVNRRIEILVQQRSLSKDYSLKIAKGRSFGAWTAGGI
jgi:isopentenyldiphosphate isomerase